MQKLRLSRHLDARPGSQPGETALCNMAYGTRILAQSDSWDKLAAFQTPQPLPDDPWLDRARSAYLLVPEDSHDPPPDFVVRLHKTLQPYADRPLTPAGLLEQVDAAEAVYRERHMPRPYSGDPRYAGALMNEPERLVEFMLDHTRAFLRADLGGEAAELDFEMVRQFSRRPAMKLRYEQQFCTPYTTQMRAARIHRHLRADRRRVLVLGDDDLVSLALLRLDPELHVDVLELDADLVAFLKEQGGARLTVLEHNLRHGVPESMRAAYDVVTTDPPYAAAGMRFFLDCVQASLKPDGRLFLSTFPGLIESPSRLWSDLEELGLTIVERHDHFSRYIYNNSYRVEHLAALRHLGSPLHPTAELLGFPFLYAHFFECSPAGR